MSGCNEGGPDFRASRTPVHGCSRAAALNRFAPETEPPYGMPLNVESPFAFKPRIRPYVV